MLPHPFPLLVGQCQLRWQSQAKQWFKRELISDGNGLQALFTPLPEAVQTKLTRQDRGWQYNVE